MSRPGGGKGGWKCADGGRAGEELHTGRCAATTAPPQTGGELLLYL